MLVSTATVNSAAWWFEVPHGPIRSLHPGPPGRSKANTRPLHGLIVAPASAAGVTSPRGSQAWGLATGSQRSGGLDTLAGIVGYCNDVRAQWRSLVGRRRSVILRVISRSMTPPYVR